VLQTETVSASADRVRQRLSRWWRGFDLAEKVGLVGILVLCAGAIAVRAWLIFGYGQGFIGFPDSSGYVLSAQRYSTVFGSRQPAGYPLSLWVLHLFSDQLSVPILVQHVSGIVAGVLLYKAVRRTGAPPYLGLLPAAIVFFGGTGLFLEHSILSDSLFTFAQAVGLYAAVRALSEPRLRWPLLAGLAIGLSFWLRTVGIASAVLVPTLLFFAAPGGVRRRLISGTAAAFTTIMLVIAYVVAQGDSTGYWGYERQGAWNLYGRVATFVDCSHFTPPKGTAFLCPAEPVGHRKNQSYFQYAPSSPAVRRFGPPAVAPPGANALLQRFSIAAIERQPGAYVDAILSGLTFFISADRGEGYTPDELRETLFDRIGNTKRPGISRFYRNAHSGATTGSIHSLVFYESHTRVQGAFLVALLLGAVVGAPLLRGRLRWATLLFTLTAVLSAIVSVAGNRYDARYAYPTFGPLAAGAALGAWGIATRLKQVARRRHATTATRVGLRK
jgi:hypothetical protein